MCSCVVWRLQRVYCVGVSQEAACMHEASDVGANSDACTDDSGSGANSDSYCSQDSGNSNEPSCDLEGVKEHTQGLKDGHMHDDTGIEPHKWWLDAPPTGGWQFRTEWQPSSFVEKEYQLYRCGIERCTASCSLFCSTVNLCAAPDIVPVPRHETSVPSSPQNDVKRVEQLVLLRWSRPSLAAS